MESITTTKEEYHNILNELQEFPSMPDVDERCYHHNERVVVLNHQPHGCLLNHLFGRGPKKTSKLHVTGHCAGNSPVTGEFPAQMASNAENVSIWWRHHVLDNGKQWKSDAE